MLLCTFALFLALFSTTRYGALLGIMLSSICLYPFGAYSICGYYVAFFDAPSTLSVCLSAVYISSVISHMLLKALHSSIYARMLRMLPLSSWHAYDRYMRAMLVYLSRICVYLVRARVLPLWAQVWVFILGLVLYLGVLGIYVIDIYHINERAQVIILALWIFSICGVAPLFGVLASAALCYSAWVGQGLYEGVLDVGLWLWCAIALSAHMVKKHIKA